MSGLLTKIEANKKSSIPVKVTLELDKEVAVAFNELVSYFGEKEILTILLEDPKSLEKTLKSRDKEKVNLSKSAELNESQIESLSKLKKDGFSMSEILTVAIHKMNPKKELRALKKQLGDDGLNSTNQNSESEMDEEVSNERDDNHAIDDEKESNLDSEKSSEAKHFSSSVAS